MAITLWGTSPVSPKTKRPLLKSGRSVRRSVIEI
jgi:hypothetical protein